MRFRARMLTTAVPLAGLFAAALAVPAAGATGTWTTITSPKGPSQKIYPFFSLNADPSPDIVISGTASSDVANVNVFCFSDFDQRVSSQLNTAPLAVDGTTHEFSGTITINGPSTGCVLRAVPDTYGGISFGTNTGYVAAFRGPTFFYGGRITATNTAEQVIGSDNLVAQERGYNRFSSADITGLHQMYARDPFSMNVAPVYDLLDALTLTEGNVVPSGDAPVRSSIVVDGVNGYLPATLDAFVSDGSTVPDVTLSRARNASTGDVTVTETSPISACAGNAYPQDADADACTAVDTGVSLQRTLTTSHQGAVVVVRDSFVSKDNAAHAVKVEYAQQLGQQTSGQVGVRLPGDSGFHAPVAGQTKTLPAGAGTIYTTTDVHAVDGQGERVTGGLTYSGNPQVYFNDADAMALRYTRTVPKGGLARMTFAREVGFSMQAVSALAAAMQKSFAPHLRMTSPKSGATVHNSFTVKGKVTNATNGYPGAVTVTVGGGSKTVKVGSTGSWSATFSRSDGTYRATATSKDPGGVKLADSVKFKVT
jgi:hypothetical protein